MTINYRIEIRWRIQSTLLCQGKLDCYQAIVILNTQYLWLPNYRSDALIYYTSIVPLEFTSAKPVTIAYSHKLNSTSETCTEWTCTCFVFWEYVLGCSPQKVVIIIVAVVVLLAILALIIGLSVGLKQSWWALWETGEVRVSISVADVLCSATTGVGMKPALEKGLLPLPLTQFVCVRMYSLSTLGLHEVWCVFNVRGWVFFFLYSVVLRSPLNKQFRFSVDSWAGVWFVGLYQCSCARS